MHQLLIRLLAAIYLFAGLTSATHAAQNGLIHQIPMAEYNALVALYNATDGPNWDNKAGWLDPNATEWHGVTVFGVIYDGSGNVLFQGSVERLELLSNGLDGEMPDALGDLTFLDYLELSANYLSGVIPEALADLDYLSTLNLAGNRLVGTIPATLGSSSHLYVVELSSNRGLRGAIPATLGPASFISVLDCSLSGPIPPAVLPKLDYIGYNYFTLDTATRSALTAAGVAFEPQQDPLVGLFPYGPGMTGSPLRWDAVAGGVLPPSAGFEVFVGVPDVYPLVVTAESQNSWIKVRLFAGAMPEATATTQLGEFGHEQFVLQIDPFGLLPGVHQGSVKVFAGGGVTTIPVTYDNSPPTVSVSVVPGAIPEDGPPSAYATVTLTRSGGDTSQSLPVSYTLGGTATLIQDYTLVGESTFASGQTTVTLFVSPLTDSVPEPDETVVFNLGSSPLYELGTPSSATLTITNDDGAEIVLEQPLGTNLTDGTAEVVLNPGVVGAAGDAEYVTVRNIGTATLSLGTITVNGAHAADFTLNTAGMSTTVFPGTETTFSLTFVPAALGVRTAVLHIANNDVDENPFDITLMGTGQTPAQALNTVLNAAGLSGPDAAFDAMPFHDGVENLLKVAFNMKISSSDSRTMLQGGSGGLPAITAQPNGASSIFRYEFLRRISSGLIYLPQKNGDLTNPNTWVPLTDEPTVISLSANWERVIYEEPYDSGITPQCFGRVQVTLPP